MGIKKKFYTAGFRIVLMVKVQGSHQVVNVCGCSQLHSLRVVCVEASRALVTAELQPHQQVKQRFVGQPDSKANLHILEHTVFASVQCY